MPSLQNCYALDISPGTSEVVQLAVMEVEEENTENLIQFWNLLNEMLQEVSGGTWNEVQPKWFYCRRTPC